MSDAEERWTDRLFEEDCKRRGFDVEIKDETDVTGQGYKCRVAKCAGSAVKRYEVGEVAGKGGLEIDLCTDHDSEDQAYEEYHKILNDGPDEDF